MNLELTENQKMIRDMTREFAEKDVAPSASELDRSETFPSEIIKKAGDLGLLGIMIPKEYGGAGVDAVTYALVIEELSKACSSTATRAI